MAYGVLSEMDRNSVSARAVLTRKKKMYLCGKCSFDCKIHSEMNHSQKGCVIFKDIIETEKKRVIRTEITYFDSEMKPICTDKITREEVKA